MTNHTDKELLILAARAVGYDINHPMNSERQEMIPPVLGFVTYLNGELQSTLWNPLDDDGQALRLAVNLGMELDIDIVSCTATYKSGGYFNLTEVDDNPYAATRRAIVRAAAAIGERL